MKRTPATIATSPIFGIVSTAVMGALPLIDASKLDSAQRRAVHVTTAVVTGVYVALTMGGGASGKKVLLKTAAGLAAAGIAWRCADAGDAIDARLEQKLRLAGAKNPRRWMALGAAALTFAGFLGDRIAARPNMFEAVPLDQLQRARPVNPAVRRLVEGMLQAGEVAGADVLRAQLEAAQEIYWSDAVSSTVQFSVPDELPRAVPHNQVFPIRAQFAGSDGTPLEALVQVSDGKIEYLAIEPVNQENLDQVGDPVHGWPDPSEVEYVLETPDGKSAPIVD